MISTKSLFWTVTILFWASAKAQTEVNKKPIFEKEFGCYSNIVDFSFYKPKGFEGKFYFSGVVKDAKQIMSVEKRLGKGKVARLYFFTDDGAYPYAVNQTKKFNEYNFYITTHGKGRVVAFDRTITENGHFKSLSFLRQNTKSINSAELPVVVDADTRSIFRDALAERIQYVKSTFDRRTIAISEALKKLDPQSPNYQDQKESIPPMPVANEYIEGLQECRKALEPDIENQSLVSLVDAEISKMQSTQTQVTKDIGVPAQNK